MIKRGKKKWKLKQTESDLLHSPDVANSVTQSRNVRAALGQRSDIEERQSRNMRRIRSPRRKTKVLWSRSHSVPIKSVSFSPYVLHRFEHTAPRVKALNYQNSCCSANKLKNEMKRTCLPTRKKLMPERSLDHVHNAPSCMSSNNLHNNHDYYYGIRGSPGPSRASHQAAYSSTELNCFRSPSSALPNVTGERSPSEFQVLCTYGDRAYLQHQYGSSSTVASPYISPGTKYWLQNKPSLAASPRVNKWDRDAKFNFLMAKYSEHNYPRSHPARAEYFNYGRNSSQTDYGNVSQNKSTSTRKTFINSAIPSAYRNLDNNYHYGAEGPFRYIFNHSGNALIDVETYRSEAMRSLAYDSLVKKCVYQPYSSREPQTSAAVISSLTDSEKSARNRKSRRHERDFLPGVSSSAFESHLAPSQARRSRYDHLDEMRMPGRYRALSASASMSTASGVSQLSLDGNFRSRSSDTSYLALPQNYSDNNKLFQGKSSLIRGGDSTKSVHRNMYGWSDGLDKISGIKAATMLTSAGSRNDHRRAGSSFPAATDGNSPSRNWFSRIRRITNTKIPQLLGYKKTTDADERVNESDPARRYEMFTNSSFSSSVDFGGPFSKTLGGTKDRPSDVMSDTLNTFQASRPGQNRSTDFSSTYSRRRDASLSPVAYHKAPNIKSGNATSHLKSSDLSQDRLYDPEKQQGSELQLKIKKIMDKYSAGPKRVTPTFDSDAAKGHSTTLMNYRSPTSDMKNHSRNSFHLGGRSTPYRTPENSVPGSYWKKSPYAEVAGLLNDSVNEPHLTNASYSQKLDVPSSISEGSWYENNEAEMLSAWVDQESDRLKSLANAIQIQHDTSNDL